MLEIGSTEGHPEACALDGRIVLDKRLKFLMVKEVGLLRTNLWIVEWLMEFKRFGLYPFAVFPVETFLCNLTDINFRIDGGGKCFVAITCVAVHDVEIVNLVKVVLGSIGCVDGGHARVKSAAKDSCETSLLKSLLEGPLPGVLEVGLIFWFIVGCVEIIDSALQTCLHDGEILIGKGEVHHDVGLYFVEELHEFIHIVSIYLCGLDAARRHQPFVFY